MDKQKKTLLNIHSIILEIYFDCINMTSIINNYTLQEEIIKDYSNRFKEINTNFTEDYIYFNLEVGNKLNLLYKKWKFYKIEGFWEELDYYSSHGKELEYILFYLYSINITKLYLGYFNTDLNNFIFFSGKKKRHSKADTIFVKLLYFLCANFHDVFTKIFDELKDSLFLSFNEYIYSNLNYYFLLEILGLLFFIVLFLSVIVYLYYSNQIILKNIIFLFLDFGEDNYGKNSINTNNKVMLKLLELKFVIDDFSLEKLQNYSENLDIINKAKEKNIRLNHKKLSNLLINSEFDSNITIANNANTTRNIIQRSLNINNIKFSSSNIKTKPAMRNSINKTNSKNQINQINHINNIEKDIQNVQRINSKKKNISKNEEYVKLIF